MRRIAIAACAAALVVVPISPASTAQLDAEPRGMTCSLSGAAKFTPGLTAEAQDIKFKFKGEVTDCQSSGGATSGVVTSKGTVADASCASGAGEGIAKVKWDDGTSSIIEFETTDVTALVYLEGTATKSNADVPAEGDPIYGALGFDADPTLCETEEGITNADFMGQVGGGSPQ